MLQLSGLMETMLSRFIVSQGAIYLMDFIDFLRLNQYIKPKRFNFSKSIKKRALCSRIGFNIAIPMNWANRNLSFTNPGEKTGFGERKRTGKTTLVKLLPDYTIQLKEEFYWMAKRFKVW
jgi:ABC-type multidrug transport system fused ATPase/permease subunit